MHLIGSYGLKRGVDKIPYSTMDLGTGLINDKGKCVRYFRC